jgi:hypothetical protein
MWNKATDSEDSFRDKAIWWSAGIVIAGAIAVGVYYRYYSPMPATPPQHQAAPPQAAAPAPAIQHPIPSSAEQQAQQTPLPPLDQSDPIVRDSLIGLLGKPAVAKFLVPHQVVRDLVVTVDNLPRKKVAAELRPLQPTAGDTAVDTQGGATDLSQQNYQRYAELMDVVRTSDPKALAAVYFRLYPLFQQAYENLGYPGKYFNDRMVQAIDSLLATPDVPGPISLVRPKVFYQFADPKLEALPAGQKVLIRMGPQNAGIVKQKLQQLRAAITAQPPQMSAAPQAAPVTAPQDNSGAQANPLPQGSQAAPANPPPPQQPQSPQPPF